MSQNITISVAEATEYIQSRYTAFNPLRGNWDILTDEEKAVYVNQSYDEIRGLHLRPTTPETVIKEAIAENALAIMDKEINALSDMQFKVLQSMGQQKNTKYNRREQGDVLGINTVAKATEYIPITGAKAYAMLKKYIGGSYPIL